MAHHGETGIGGLVFVGAILMDDVAQWFGPATRHLAPMASADMGEAIEASQQFVDSFYETAPSEEEARTLMAYTMMTPHHVRKALLGREADYERHWVELSVPVLLSHGVEDHVIDVGMSENAAELFEHAETSYLDGIGHVPFLEAPDRFNTELAEFVRNLGEEWDRRVSLPWHWADLALLHAPPAQEATHEAESER